MQQEKKRYNKIMRFLLFIIFFSTAYSYCGTVQNVSTGTSVTFNLLCAKCHEGECSGRLSFNSGSKKAANHIQRYAKDKDLSQQKTVEFFTLLNYMKKECALWMPENEKFDAGDLSRFALPSYKGYFIPLGLLKSANYGITIKTKEKIHFDVEVMSRNIDSLLNYTVFPDSKDNVLHFTIEKPVKAFLRIRSRKPLHIISVKCIQDP